jgi:hypothetical protein
MSETTAGTAAKAHDAAKVEEKRRHPEPAQGGLGGSAGDTLLLDGLLGSSAMDPRLERHAAILSDPRFSHSANTEQKVQVVSGLQGRYGNAYVQRLLDSRTVQAKLTVNPPADQYEREADAVSERAAKTASVRREPKPEVPENGAPWGHAASRLSPRTALVVPEKRHESYPPSSGHLIVSVASSQWISRRVPYNVDDSGGRVRDPEKASGVLPFTANGWEGEEIGRKFSQVGDVPGYFAHTDLYSCVETSFLVALIQRGPGALRDVIERYLKRYEVQSIGANSIEQIKYRLAAKQLEPMLKKIDSRKLTYEDLRTMRAHMYIEIATPGGGTKVEDQANMFQQQGYATTPVETGSWLTSNVTREEASVEAAKLQPGEFLACQVKADNEGFGKANHAVHLGRQADGTLYFYDPWPVQGDQMTKLSPDLKEIAHYFATRKRALLFNEGRTFIIESKVSPPANKTKAAAPPIQPKAEEGEEIRARLYRQAKSEEEQKVQTVTPTGAVPEVAQGLEERINAARGNGETLPDSMRSSFEVDFGSDFGDVRVHTDAEADNLSRSVGGKAFTTGKDIFFRSGDYHPHSEQDKKLIAHELTHVVQQIGVPVAGGVLAPVQRIQRAATTGGLAGTATAEGFAYEVLNYWKANPTKTRAEFAQDIISKKLNSQLLYPVTTVITTSGDKGALIRSIASFGISINTTAFSKNPPSTIRDLTEAEVAEVAGTLYHEARHAQQILSIAQVQAGQGKSAAEISVALSIPPAAADAAKKSPLDSTKPENATLIAEAEAWKAFMAGKYTTYKKEVGLLEDEIAALKTTLNESPTTDVITKVGPELTKIETHLTTFFDPKKQEIDNLTKKEPYDTEVSERIADIREAFDDLKDEYDAQKGDEINISILKTKLYKLYKARWDAYRAYEHEKDAWDVGGAAAKNVKRLTAATTP